VTTWETIGLHFAPHGNALNPGTGKPAELPELRGQFHIAWRKGAFNKADCFSKHHPTARHRDLQFMHLHEPSSRNSNCFNCLRDDDDDDDSDAIATADDSASDTLHAQPKASRSNAAPAGEGVLIPPHAGHASHTAYACTLFRTLEQTC
jgi:hypothetical protein